jgi:Flp pilus assembly protein TadG
MTNAVANIIHAFRYQLARFARHAEGLAALEFAIILPVMLVTLFGAVGVTSVISIDRKVTLVARTLSDLTSQSTAVTDSDINNFFAIGNAMLTPYSAVQNPASGGPLKATITEIYIDPNTGAARVQWSKGNAPRATGSVVASMPSGLIGKDASNKILANQYFILSEVSYLYAPSILPGVASVPLQESTYTRPRITANWYCVKLNNETNCPTN